jgi:hypothetical protein
MLRRGFTVDVVHAHVRGGASCGSFVNERDELSQRFVRATQTSMSAAKDDARRIDTSVRHETYRIDGEGSASRRRLPSLSHRMQSANSTALKPLAIVAGFGTFANRRTADA